MLVSKPLSGGVSHTVITESRALYQCSKPYCIHDISMLIEWAMTVNTFIDYLFFHNLKPHPLGIVIVLVCKATMQ